MTWSWMFTVFFSWIPKAAGTKCFLTPAPHPMGWCRVKFWRTSWHKNAGKCYHRKLQLWKKCSSLGMTASASVSSDCTLIHVHALSSICTAWCCPLPCAWPSLRAESFPHLCQDLWKPGDFWPEILGSVRRDPSPQHKALRGGLDSPDKLIMRRTHFCSKSWLVPRAYPRWESEQLISWLKM